MAQVKIWFSYKKRVSPIIHFGMLDNTTLYFKEDFIKRGNVKIKFSNCHSVVEFTLA